MNLLTDEPGHFYAEVENIRITYIPVRDRNPATDWAESDVIRVQAYRGSNNKALHQGAELPISSPDVFINLIANLCDVYNEGRRNQTNNISNR